MQNSGHYVSKGFYDKRHKLKELLKIELKELKNKSLKLPESPGVYIMKDLSGKIIYIGKAKVLKNRVSQYFGSQNNHSEKVKQMVSQVYDFEYIVTDSEFEALVLECSLIKQHMPKYNILLKDDKGYHYIKVTNDEWPRILVARKIDKDGATYIGPYMSSWAVKNAVDEVEKIFLLPSCSKKFSEKKTKERPCLNYYIKQCSAPCVGAVSRASYLEQIRDAVDFLKGGDTASISKMTEKMNAAAQKLNFETAAKLRDRIITIKKLSEKQKVVELKTKNQDVISFAKNVFGICFEVFKIRDGKFKDREEFFLKSIISDEGGRSEFIQQFYSMDRDPPPQIFLDGEVESKDSLEKWLSKISGKKVHIEFPKKGDKAKLVAMCKKNAEESLIQRSRKFSQHDILSDLQNSLSLPSIPNYIEAYDISNLAGTDNVAGMIVYEDAKPNKSMYKRFKIKEIIGQDDYGSMREVINRRINELEKTQKSGETNGFEKIPDLILLDGGKGHVRAVKEVLEKRGYKDIPVFGMVKDSKHRTRAISKDFDEININNNQRLFSFITGIQDEVHRFAISYHRKRKSSKLKSTKLLEIPGVGKTRTLILFKHFKTIGRIKQATVDELKIIPGINNNVAQAIYKHFHQSQKNKL